MGRSQKSKRVTWASDVNLCQVKLFLSEDSPSQVGLGSQDHLQAKILWPLQSGGTGSDDNLPPGFEGIQPGNMWRVNLSQIPLVKWKCPPRFKINSDWQVVAGEESTEMEAQNERELRVLEAIYPRPSAIPPNPAALAGIEDSDNNDKETPVVPVTPIEDEDSALDSSTSLMTENIPAMMPAQHFPFSSQSTATAAHPQANGISATGLEPDIVAAAQAALTSVMSNSDSGTLIDRDLLIKILSNPKMVEQLVTNHGGSSCAQNPPSVSTQNMPQSSIVPSMPIMGVQTMAPSSSHVQSSNLRSSIHSMPSTSNQFTPNFRPMPMANITRPELIPPSTATTNGPIYPPSRIGSIPNQRPSAPHGISAPSPSVGGPMAKDINYYKSLIQQHGEEKREVLPQFSNQEPSNIMKSRDSKPRIMKPCMYFNGPRGCRNGTNCPFQHDTSSQQRVNGVPDVQSAKRVKLDREITGT